MTKLEIKLGLSVLGDLIGCWYLIYCFWFLIVWILVYEFIKDGFGKLLIPLLIWILVWDCVLINCGFEWESVIFGLNNFGGKGGEFLNVDELGLPIGTITGNDLITFPFPLHSFENYLWFLLYLELFEWIEESSA